MLSPEPVVPPCPRRRLLVLHATGRRSQYDERFSAANGPADIVDWTDAFEWVVANSQAQCGGCIMCSPLHCCDASRVRLSHRHYLLPRRVSRPPLLLPQRRRVAGYVQKWSRPGAYNCGKLLQLFCSRLRPPFTPPIMQMPVDVNTETAVFAAKNPLRWAIPFHHSSGDEENSIMYNGHTVEITPSLSAYVFYDGKKYKLVQFHFHTPSENRIDGHAFASEVHLVHQAADRSLMVTSAAAACRPSLSRLAAGFRCARSPQPQRTRA
jgi:hypothetical protein